MIDTAARLSSPTGSGGWGQAASRRGTGLRRRESSGGGSGLVRRKRPVSPPVAMGSLSLQPLTVNLPRPSLPTMVFETEVEEESPGAVGLL